MVSVNPGVDIGDILYWDGSAWVVLSPGDVGKVLLTQGVGAAPIWGVPGGFGVIEGDYEAWAVKWGWSVPNGVDSYPPGPATYMDEANGIFYMWWAADSPAKSRFAIYNIIDHSAVFESPVDIDYPADDAYVSGAGDYTFTLGCHGFAESIFRSHQTYILLLRGDPSYYYSTVEIWRAGNLLLRHNVELDTGEVESGLRSAELSLTAKYFMFYDTKGDKLWLYEGLSTILDSGTSTNVNESQVQDTSKSWTPGEWVGKWVKVADGNGQGYLALCSSNGATVLTCTTYKFVTAGMVTGDGYKILDY